MTSSSCRFVGKKQLWLLLLLVILAVVQVQGRMIHSSKAKARAAASREKDRLAALVTPATANSNDIPTQVEAERVARMSADAMMAAAADEKHRVVDLPGAPVGYNTPMYAGLLPVFEEELQNPGSLYYWLVEKDNKPAGEVAPLVIWLNGGPGCGSVNNGFFQELGPFQMPASMGGNYTGGPTGDATSGDGSSNSRANDPVQLVLRDGRWNKAADVLFVDQPVGTGFSIAKSKVYAKNQHEVDVMFVQFLLNFLLTYPQYRGLQLYLAGESYAGIYIPSFATRIASTALSLGQSQFFSLQGIMIGNGWSSPYYQSPSYGVYALNIGLLSSQQYASVAETEVTCQQQIQAIIQWQKDNDADADAVQASPLLAPACDQVYTAFTEAASITKNEANQVSAINIYDYREYYVDDNLWPPATVPVTDYCNQKAVQQALHMEPGTYEACAEGPYTALTDDENSVFTDRLFPPLLRGSFLSTDNRGGIAPFFPPTNINGTAHANVSLNENPFPPVRVLLYNGQFDIICNHLGTEMYLNALDWEGQEEWQSTNRSIWNFENSVAGYIQSVRNLTYVVVTGGSHMVPLNKPRQMLSLITNFLNVTEVPTDASVLGALKVDKYSRFPAIACGVNGGGDQPSGGEKAEAEDKHITSGMVTLLVVIAFVAGVVGAFLVPALWKYFRAMDIACCRFEEEKMLASYNHNSHAEHNASAAAGVGK